MVRNSYFRNTTLGKQSLSARQKSRQEFLGNLLDNDYTVCIRGAGNYSYRLYETLAAGRIPLFINTQCVLPFEDEIDWRRHCIWMEADDLARAGDVVAEFHRQISPEQFEEMQIANRRLWEQRLCSLGFWRHLLWTAAGRGDACLSPPTEFPLGGHA